MMKRKCKIFKIIKWVVLVILALIITFFFIFSINEVIVLK